jgi:hypothetical protein
MNGINHILTDLQTRNFLYLLKLKDERVICKNYNIGFEEFDILEFHRKKTLSAAESYIIYGINFDQFNINGVIINSFDIYVNNFFNKCKTKILNYEQFGFENHKADGVSELVVKAELHVCESLPDLLLMQHLS